MGNVGATGSSGSIESRLSLLKGDALTNELKKLSADGEFTKLSLNFCLMIFGKVQYHKKEVELEKIQKGLEMITRHTQILGSEMEKARVESQKTPPGNYKPSKEVKTIMDSIDANLKPTDEDQKKTSTRPKQSSSTKPQNASQWVERLSTYAKSFGDIAKNKTTEASKARSEFDAFATAISSMQRTIKEFRSKSTGSL